MSRQYYYLVAGLPDIFFDDKKTPVSLADFKRYIFESLSKKEQDPIRLYFWQYDNQNILGRLNDSNSEINPLGNLNEEEVEELFDLVKDGTYTLNEEASPEYLGEFIEAYKNEQAIYPGQSWEMQLTRLYYQFVTQYKNRFIARWFTFERDLNNVLTALQCRNNELKIENQLVGSNDLTEKLIKSSARDFAITDEIPNIDKLIKISDEKDPIEREKKIDELKWAYLEEETFFHYFSIEKIFAFLVKLSIAERWINLDKDTGQKIFNELLKSLEGSYEFPGEFR